MKQSSRTEADEEQSFDVGTFLCKLHGRGDKKSPKFRLLAEHLLVNPIHLENLLNSSYS